MFSIPFTDLTLFKSVETSNVSKYDIDSIWRFGFKCGHFDGSFSCQNFDLTFDVVAVHPEDCLQDKLFKLLVLSGEGVVFDLSEAQERHDFLWSVTVLREIRDTL